jgi:hypothetical protein
MIDQFYTGYAQTKNAELMQYCKLENVLPSTLVPAGKSRKIIRYRLEKTVFHLLKLVDKRLHVMISRLTADLEHGSMAQGYFS